MKFLIPFFCLIASLSASADRDRTIDDLSTIPLNQDSSETLAHDIHYPNYRMGGGNGAGRQLRDCLLLDIRHSDAVVTLEQKLKLARAIRVVEGFQVGHGNSDEKELKPTVKGNHVVFLMPEYNVYMTFLQALSRDGRDLNAIIKETLPPVRPGNSLVAPAGLVYVRDCRF